MFRYTSETYYDVRYLFRQPQYFSERTGAAQIFCITQNSQTRNHRGSADIIADVVVVLDSARRCTYINAIGGNLQRSYATNNLGFVPGTSINKRPQCLPGAVPEKDQARNRLLNRRRDVDVPKHRFK